MKGLATDDPGGLVLHRLREVHAERAGHGERLALIVQRLGNRERGVAMPRCRDSGADAVQAADAGLHTDG